MSWGGWIKSDPNYVNYNSSHWSGGLTSRAIPNSAYSLPEPQSNIQAANSFIPSQKGGNKKKYNNNKVYMRKTKVNKSKRRKSFFKKRTTKRRRFLPKMSSSLRSFLKKRKTRKMKGGYSQYMNNQALSTTYSVGGNPNVSFPSALANPAPITSLPNMAIDNYNHNTNLGFPSRGSY